MDWFDDFRRFPHRCVIYRNEGADSFGGGERVVVWEGICRKESNTSLRTFRGKDYVFKSDFRIELGAVEENGCMSFIRRSTTTTRARILS